jgi:NitT/TauT family transport system ATP-binding protein
MSVRVRLVPVASAKAPDEPVVTVDGLRVDFGEVRAIDGLSLSVRRGEFVSLLGPSGCGKSTLLKAIAGLVRPTAGGIRKADTCRRVGFMFQKPLLLPWRTVLDNVLLPTEIELGGNVVDASDRQRGVQMLEMVQLADFAGAYPHQLSGGMQQRAALARALMTDPDLLLLDEPFGALDEMTRDALNEELLGLWQSKATRLHTIIMVTHSITEAITMSDRVLVFSARPARLVEAVNVLISRPRAPEDPDSAAAIREVRSLLRGRS